MHLGRGPINSKDSIAKHVIYYPAPERWVFVHGVLGNKNFVAAIEKTGSRKIVLAGPWTETRVAIPTVQAFHDASGFT
jgi:hypothetical protein